MSLFEDIERGAERVVPQLRGARLGLYALGGVVTLLLALAAFWYVFVRPGQAVRAEGEAKVGAIAGQATAEQAQKAIELRVTADRQKLDVRVTTERGQDDVRSLPDAALARPDAAAVMRRTVCLLHDQERAAGATGPLPPDAACDAPAGPDAGDAGQHD